MGGGARAVVAVLVLFALPAPRVSAERVPPPWRQEVHLKITEAPFHVIPFRSDFARLPRPPFPAPWGTAGSLRYRLIFLRADAIAEGGPRGFRYDADGGPVDDYGPVAPEFWEVYAAYFKGRRTVEVEVDLENVGAAVLAPTEVRLMTENFSPMAGGATPSAPGATVEASSVPAGGRVRLEFSLPVVESAWYWPLQQVRLTVVERVTGRRVLDEPRAALVALP